jgi:CheY-like chemotaxis protein
MKILFIEDDEDKAKRILDFIVSDIRAAEVVCAKSFNSGLRTLILGAKSFDLVLLDMTMTSYDVTPEEPTGGSIEYFAGRDMLAQMQLRGIWIPTVVVTMFDSFGEGAKKVSLGALINELRSKYMPYFLGHVYYNATEDGWRTALKGIIERHMEREKK